MESYVNLVRKKGLTSTHSPFKLPYPDYEEYRDEKDYESIKTRKRLNEIRSDIGKEGLDEFRKLISSSSLWLPTSSLRNAIFGLLRTRIFIFFRL